MLCKLLVRGDTVEAVLYRNGKGGKREKRGAAAFISLFARKKEGTVKTVPSSFTALPVGLTP